MSPKMSKSSLKTLRSNTHEAVWNVFNLKKSEAENEKLTQT